MWGNPVNEDLAPFHYGKGCELTSKIPGLSLFLILLFLCINHTLYLGNVYFYDQRYYLNDSNHKTINFFDFNLLLMHWGYELTFIGIAFFNPFIQKNNMENNQSYRFLFWGIFFMATVALNIVCVYTAISGAVFICLYVCVCVCVCLAVCFCVHDFQKKSKLKEKNHCCICV